MTKKILNYINKQNLSVEKIASDTGIDKEVLDIGTSRPLNATEFLVICKYLRLDPWDLFQ